MKKQEALELINNKLDSTSKEEIKEILLSQDKIGNAIPTEELVEALFSQAEEIKNKEENKTSKSSFNYEKWQVELKDIGIASKNISSIDNIKEKIKKIKDVNITEEQAIRLNSSAMKGVKGTIQYIKK